MLVVRRPLLTKAIEWIPQTVALRSGITVRLRGRSDAKHFWGTFTSPEYMAFVPELVSIREPRLRVIDCGAGIGLFSLLIEHLRRLEILSWEDVSYVIVEPSSYNLNRLRLNVGANLDNESYQVLEGLIGQRDGESRFYQSPWRRWSASVYQRSHFLERETRKRYIDIGPFLCENRCVLKIDIEGAEYAFLEAYRDQLSNVSALIIEWHAECGDLEQADAVLVSQGLQRVRRRHPGQTGSSTSTCHYRCQTQPGSHLEGRLCSRFT